MKMMVVAILDQATGAYSRPVFCASKGVAVRSFQDECRNGAAGGQSNDMQRHPGDFTLYFLGTYDDSTGAFEQENAPQLLFRGLDCK